MGRNDAVKAAMIDHRPRAQQPRYEGEDRSSMAQAAVEKLVAHGTGGPLPARPQLRLRGGRQAPRAETRPEGDRTDSLDLRRHRR